jgi:hypothetical protein
MLKLAPLALFLLAAATPNWLPGPEIEAALKGQTISGRYASGFEFIETYAKDGTLSYWDPRGAATGTWSVAGDMFCTFYQAESFAGGCFRVEKIGGNCFDFFSAASSADEARSPPQTPRYTARASVNGRKSTCPVDMQARGAPTSGPESWAPHHA